MNEKNRETLVDQVFYAGFGTDHKNEIREILNDELPNSSIRHEEFVGKDLTVKSRLNFRKSATTDMQFFNSFSSGLYKGAEVIVKPQLFKQDHKYYMDQNGNPLRKNLNPTRVEAQNLLLGRAIKKDMVENINGVDQWRNAWIKMDFNNVDNKGRILREEFPNYNVEAHLNNIPFLKDREDPTKYVDRIRGLEKGNQEGFTAYNDGHEIKIFLEADPKQDELLVYNQDMKRTTVELIAAELEKMVNGITAENTVTKDSEVTQNVTNDELKGPEITFGQPEVENFENNTTVAPGINGDQNTNLGEQKNPVNLSAGDKVTPSEKDNIKQGNVFQKKLEANQKTDNNLKARNKAKSSRQRM